MGYGLALANQCHFVETVQSPTAAVAIRRRVQE